MKTLTLHRRVLTNYCPGFIALPDCNIQTLERPLITADEWRGGKPFESCVPFGIYELELHHSDRFGDVWALVNHNKGVYHYEHERRFDTDRYAILIHVANWIEDIVGCIAPGMGCNINSGQPMVTSSGKAMTVLRNVISNEGYTHLEIKPI